MLSKYALIALAVLSFAYIIVLAACNTATMPINFLSYHMDFPLALVLVKAYAAGAVTVFCIWRTQRKDLKIEQKKLEWKTEDAKLQTEIQSDKVHQLELQVKTLETALEKALKRGGK
ncbi:MAG: LapA family protein [Cyanobacteria bacterium SZAS TMP-1]|nr:LapA family protein [Cyanobacteria bacterium SZAS TMP-1]